MPGAAENAVCSGTVSPYARLNAASAAALRRYALSYLLMGFNILMGGFLTAVERPVGAICVSVGRGLAFQAAALLALAFTVGGTSIWFAPLISESVCLVVAAVFLRRFWRSPGDLADEQR